MIHQNLYAQYTFYPWWSKLAIVNPDPRDILQDLGERILKEHDKRQLKEFRDTVHVHFQDNVKWRMANSSSPLYFPFKLIPYRELC